MALGNTNIANFKPQRSSTAAKLITVAPTQETKKTERIELRINSDVKQLFKEICAENDTDISSALLTFINNVVSAGRL